MLNEERVMLEQLDHYAGAFEPDFRLERLTRAALGRLGRELTPARDDDHGGEDYGRCRQYTASDR